jgi:hypothetical protein
MTRTWATAAALLVAALVINALLLASLSGKREKLASLSAAHEEMLSLKDEFLSLERRIKAVQGRKGLGRARGIVHAVDEIFEPLGLKGKVKSVKPISTVSRAPIASGDVSIEGREEKAEVAVDGVSMNEMVNFLYSIENAPMLLVTRKVDIKPSFEDPRLLDVSMTISFIRPE